MTELPTIPVGLRVHLAHAALQATADECGVDVLHIKGPAVDPALRLNRRQSVDADVLVRPADLKRYLGALRRFGWQEVTRLTSGGVVEHSVNWYHPELGQADIHVRFPGIQIESGRAFDRLCHNRRIEAIAHWGCHVPSAEAQRLIQLLHAARNMEGRAAEIESAWTIASGAERTITENLARELHAEVALGAATGRLAEYRDYREHDLWHFYSAGQPKTEAGVYFPALVKSAPAGLRFVRVRIAHYLLRVARGKSRRMADHLERKPTLCEMVKAHLQMLRRGARELWQLTRR